MTSTLQITFDVGDPPRLPEFWATTLDYVVEPPPTPHESWEDFLKSQEIPESEWGRFSAIVDPAERIPLPPPAVDVPAPQISPTPQLNYPHEIPVSNPRHSRSRRHNRHDGRIRQNPLLPLEIYRQPVATGVAVFTIGYVLIGIKFARDQQSDQATNKTTESDNGDS